jgi:hypothetical protein
MKHKHNVKRRVIIVITVLACLLAAAAIGPKVLQKFTEAKQAKYPYVFWIDNMAGGYKPTKQPPACPDPILQMSPVDVYQATEIGYPGQYRGTDYKAHGGLSFYRSNSNDVIVKLPFDASLTGITKYVQDDSDPQYIMTFQHECGYQVLFDHLHTLGPDFAAINAKLPTQTNTQGKPPELPYGYFKAGTVIATGAGIKKNVKGGGLDFGLYDLRKKNEMSKNPRYVDLHKEQGGHVFYGLCWIDYLPKNDRERVMQILPLATDDRGASDYCSFDAGGNTLDYNNGLPITEVRHNQARE